MRSFKSARGAIIAGMLALATSATAGPPPVVGGPLLAQIQAVPAGQWARVNANLYSSVWTPVDLRPLNGRSLTPPSVIIKAWSSFAWDARRGKLILYGGGHANYSGNDVYEFLSSTLTWQRASLPSEITEIYDSNAYMAIDGADNAPGSAHTYDNNIYLPIFDRFMTLGGALFNTGGPFMRPDENTAGALRATGPYLFDPDRADGDKVGGSTGSHVQRVAPYSWVVGGHMWQNRDHRKNRPLDPQPTKHVSGCTGYAEEGGYDVVYVGATGGAGTNLDLFRYVMRSVADPAADQITKVGRFWSGTSDQRACAYDPVRKLFVMTGNNTLPFVFWDLTTAGPQNNDQRVQVNASTSGFTDWLNANGLLLRNCGLDFDPGDPSFVIWCGGGQVWRLRAPPTNAVSGWTVSAEPIGGAAPPIVTSILGKWKYIPGYDVFMALEDPNDGNIWVWKPLGWTTPALGEYVNFAPQATWSSPADNSTVTTGTTVTMRAAATDGDGTIGRVDFLVNNKLAGSATASPYTLTFTPQSAGTYTMQARAVDNLGGEGRSPIALLNVVAVNTPPTVSITAPAAGAKLTVNAASTVSAAASDNGAVVKVEFFANGALIGQDTTSPFSISWSPTQTGSVALTARATDDQGSQTLSSSVTVDVVPPNAAPTATITNPANGRSYAIGATVSIAATANDSDGSVVKVEFLANGAVIGEDSTSPYTFNWTPAVAGSYALTARAVDNLGVTGSSAAINVIVTDGSTIAVVMQDGSGGYAGTTDTQLSSYAPTLNYGGATMLTNYAQNYASLFRFAVFASEGGPVPNGATIVSAKLEIYKTYYNYVYRVHAMLKPWSEMQATWNVSQTGMPWAVAGAKGVGTDYASAYDAEFSAPWDPGWMTFDVTNRIRLIGQGAANYGWRVVPVTGYNSTRRFYSREYSDPTLRPRLTVQYAAP